MANLGFRRGFWRGGIEFGVGDCRHWFCRRAGCCLYRGGMVWVNQEPFGVVLLQNSGGEHFGWKFGEFLFGPGFVGNRRELLLIYFLGRS